MAADESVLYENEQAQRKRAAEETLEAPLCIRQAGDPLSPKTAIRNASEALITAIKKAGEIYCSVPLNEPKRK
ncbi:hypothetical protein G7Y89_g11368 [Cudoniella acicularis]|uniref:Uncharacterized protein n=1 Tax=Cudoniella acicularis TaxID=354080 RepID=A0A8H4VYC3_9HELO|nr:hypothetical protein G7Y89_g11368 [Cudoniella acicularis]